MSRYTMGPCDFCGSSDAFASYDDGVGTCFSCNRSKKLNVTEEREEQRNQTNYDMVTDITSYTSYQIHNRNNTKEATEQYGGNM